jgi:DNA-binding transcriptional LysR family regulator
MIETRQIRYFVALAEHLHFGKAALALNMAQPALSQQIRQLEDELGTPLFERNTRRVTLLPAGNNFLARAQAILHELSLAVEEARDINVGQSGSVRIGFVSTAAPRLIPELLHRLRRKYPRIQVDLYETDPDDQVQQLHWLKIDIGLMLFHPNDPALNTAVIARNRVMVALPRKHPLAARKAIPIKELANETFVLSPKFTHPDFREFVLDLCRRHGVVPKRTQQVGLIQTALSLVAGGAGIAFIPESLEELRPRSVVFRPLAGPEVSVPLYAVWKPGGETKVVANVLAEIISTQD